MTRSLLTEPEGLRFDELLVAGSGAEVEVEPSPSEDEGKEPPAAGFVEEGPLATLLGASELTGGGELREMMTAPPLLPCHWPPEVIQVSRLDGPLLLFGGTMCRVPM